MSAVVLSPSQLAVEQPNIHRRHSLLHVIVGDAKAARAKQTEYRLCRDCCHEASLVIEPLRITPLRNTVAHERETRRAEGEQLVRIDRYIVRGLAPEGGCRGAVLQEVTGHPVILTHAGEILDRFAEVASMQLGSAFAR